MCMKQSSKAARMAQMVAQQQIDAQQQALAAAEADRKVTQGQAAELQSQQLAFNERQQAFAESTQAKNDELANRPPPPPPPPAAVQVTGGTVGAAASDDVDIKKKGRKALRIDMTAPQTAGATGLNIARG